MFSNLLIFLGLLASLPALADAETRLTAFVAASKSLKAEFSQTVTDRNGRKTQTSSGELAFSRPGKFRWTYHKPYSQVLVGDGQKLWIYDPDLQQVTVRKLDQALGGSPAALLAGDNDIKRLFILKDTGSRAGLDWIEASAKAKDSGFESVQMGFKDDELRRMELKDNFGQTTRLDFSHMQLNPSLPSSLFRFSVPKGADLIGDH